MTGKAKRVLTRIAMFALAIIIGMLSLSACGQSGPTWQEQYDLGVRYLSEGNYEEAIIAFTAAIEIDPKRPQAFIGRGDAYTGTGTEESLTAAISDYKEALTLDEMLVDAWLGLAQAYLASGDIDSAIETLEAGLAVVPENDRPELETVLEELSWTVEGEFPDGEEVPGDLMQFSAVVTSIALEPPLQGTNEGSVGQLSLHYTWETETVPADLRETIQTALIATWAPEGFSEEEILQFAGMYEEIWREEGSLWKDYPNSNGAFPVWEDDLGTTTQVLLYALDDQADIVGYLILPITIPAE